MKLTPEQEQYFKNKSKQFFKDNSLKGISNFLINKDHLKWIKEQKMKPSDARKKFVQELIKLLKELA